MRGFADREKIESFLQALGRAATGPGEVFLCGGATAVLLGFRESTLDVDLHFDPEPPGVFSALPELKDRLDLNVELAWPHDFVPALPGWRDRSPLVSVAGVVRVRHADPYGQVLAKLERGHVQDLRDVEEFVVRRLVSPERLLELYRQLAPDALSRYPALDADVLRRKVEALAGTATSGGSGDG